MVVRYPIGPSSYSDGTPTSPRGKMQYVTTALVALQVRSAAVEFDRDVLKNNGEHLTPNEGVRELDRQEDLYDLYLHHGGALAAVPGYSTHDPKIGTAIDFGITRADGTNRALTSAEFNALYAILARRGIVHTGANFARYEAWHCNGGFSYSLPPITGVPLMGTKTTSQKQDDDDNETARKVLMAASDTLTMYQRTVDGKDQDTYFVAGPKIAAYLIRDGKIQPLGLRIGVQLTSRELREVFYDDGVKAVKLDKTAFDRRVSMYAALAEL